MSPTTTDVDSRERALEQRSRARREARSFARRLAVLLVAVLALVLAGTVGFTVTERHSFAYSFIWTMDTITTVGGIPNPSDTPGRIVVVGLEVLGIGTLFYGLATVAEFFVSGQLSGMLGERRTQRMLDSYSDHVIVCGFGRVGRQVARDLARAGVRQVAIDSEHRHREAAEAIGVRFIESLAADDDVLLRAGIARARAVIACVDSDAENIFIVLTARELAPGVLIVARASGDDAEKKLRRAGADRVISPYKTSGSEMARVVVRPQVGGAVEVGDYIMEEIDVSAASAGAGKTIQEIRGQAVIVAIRRPDGRLEAQPDPGTVLSSGDMLVALGTAAALEQLEATFQPAPVHR